MIEDNIEVNVNNTIEVIDVFPQITEEVVDINLLDNREDVLINVTESIIEVNINKVTNILSAVWGSITGTLSDQTDLQSALNAKQDDITLTVIGSSGSSTLVGSTLNVPTYSLAGLGGVSGSGTTNYLSKFTGSTSIGNSLIYDNGTNVGIGTTSPTSNGGGTSKVLHINAGAASEWAITHYTNGSTGSAAADGLVVGVIGGLDSYIFNYESSNLIFGTSAAEKMRITSGGNVGIGTTASVRRLEVASDGSNWISGTFSGSGGTDKVVIGNLGNTATIGGHTSALTAWSPIAISGSPILFQISGTEKMRLDASGNVGIGTTSPAEKLSIKAADAAIKLEGTTNSYLFQVVDSNNRLRIFDNTNNVERLTITSSGSVGIGTTSPTEKLHVAGNIKTTNSLIVGIDNVAGYKVLAITPSSTSTPANIQGTHSGIGAYDITMQTGGGNVGIGTTSPSQKLEVVGAGLFGVAKIGNWSVNSGFARFGHTSFDGGSNYGFMQDTGGIIYLNGVISYHSATKHIFSGGSVGIGTTSPAQKLHVVGGIRGEYYSSVNNKGLNQIVDFIDLDNVRYQMTFEDGILVGYVVT